MTSQATQTNPAAGRKRRGFFARLTSGLTSLAGFMTALATIMTSASAILGLVVHHQSQQLQQAHAQVSHQAQQITQLQHKVTTSTSTPRTTTTPTPAATPSSGPGAQVTGQGNYLSSLTPTVENAGYGNGAQVMSAKSYPNSVELSCSGGSASQPGIAYNVAGNTIFTAEIGIPDNMSNATDVTATITFSDESGQQVGKPVQVSLGHPASVSLNIKGITQLGMTCNGVDDANNQSTSGFDVALGSAAVS